MKFSLRQMEVFLAVAHYENVSRAADELAMSQSAASGALKELEQQFNVQLFDRIGKRLQLNETGRRLQARAESLLAQSREIEDDLNKQQGSGSLTIGATLTIGNYLCVDLMARYLTQVPQARIHLNIANTETITRELLAFEIDIGMLEGETNHPDLDIHPWRDDELLCFCAPQSALAGKPLDQKTMLTANWILREHGSGTRQCFERSLAGLMPQLVVQLELEQTEAIKRAVMHNIGISCLSKIALQEDLERGTLVALETPGITFKRHLYLATHRHKYRSAGIDLWLALCQ